MNSFTLLTILSILGVCHGILDAKSHREEILFKRDQPQCDVTGQSIKTLFSCVFSDRQLDLVERVLGENSFSDVICELEDAETIDQIKPKLDELGLLYNSFRVGYNHIATYLILIRYYAQTYGIEEGVQAAFYDIISTLEASGVLSLDPEGASLSSDYWGADKGIPSEWQDDYTPAAPSDDTIRKQCYTLTAQIIKVSNLLNKEVFADFLLTWTGVDVMDETALKDSICALMDGGLQGGLHGLYRAFNGRLDMTGHLTRRAYVALLDVITSQEKTIDWWESQDVEYRSDAMIELDNTKTKVFDELRAMGLLELKY